MDNLLSWPPRLAHTPLLPPPSPFRLGGSGLSSGAAAAGQGVLGLRGSGILSSSVSIEYGMVSSDDDISASYKRIRIITLQLAHTTALKETHQICAKSPNEHNAMVIC